MAKHSRIDYAIANPKAVTLVKGFRTRFETAIATHARLEIDLMGKNATPPVNVQNKPQSLSATIKMYIDKATEHLTE